MESSHDEQNKAPILGRYYFQQLFLLLYQDNMKILNPLELLNLDPE